MRGATSERTAAVSVYVALIPRPGREAVTLHQVGVGMRTEVLGSGPELALLPGGLTGWVTFEPHAHRLAANRQVIRVQLLNVDLGLEGRPLPNGYSHETESAAFLRTLDRLGVAEADLVGWSYGGVVALDATLKDPERVRSLTLIEPPVWSLLRDQSDLWAQAQEFQRMMREFGTDYVSEDELEEFLLAANMVPPEVDARGMPQWSRWSEHRQSLRTRDLAGRSEVDIGQLRRFERPVLLFKGEGSSAHMREVMNKLATGFPQARLEELPGGHALPVVSMDAFLAILQEFLAEQH